MAPRIVYHDASIIVVEKPAGLLTHATQTSREPTLVDFLVARWPEIKGVGDPSTGSQRGLRPGVVHRLDKDTSGLMVVAKTQETFEYLKRAFQERRVTKKYLALVYGTMPGKEGEISFPIGFGSHGALKRSVARGKGVRGERAAQTLWRLKKQYEDCAFLEVEPKTGRTHQIRVHLAAIGHPVAGDPIYRFRKSIDVAGLTRQFLHASYLAFSLPGGHRFEFESDLPRDLKIVLDNL